jgi:hypothetical protein
MCSRNLDYLLIGNTVYSVVQYFSSVAKNYTAGQTIFLMESWGSALS